MGVEKRQYTMRKDWTPPARGVVEEKMEMEASNE